MGKFEFKSSILLMFLVLWPFVLGYLFEQATPVAAQRPPPPPPPGPFEYFRLALSWSPAVCTLTPITNCPRDFTIHGLWPDNHSGGLLRSCTTQRFVPITDPCLLPRLNAKWPNLRSGTNNAGFWGSQWSAHGTCATGYTQPEYFTLAVDLKDRFANLLQHLNRNEISPDRNTLYPVHCIKDAIQKLTTKIPDLMCVGNRLQEIRICFNRKMATNPNHPVIDCPEHHASGTCRGNILFFQQ